MQIIVRPIGGKRFRFIVSSEPRLHDFWGSFVAVFSRQKLLSSPRPAYMFRTLNKRWFQTPAKSLLGSSIINILLVLALLWFVKPSAVASNNFEIVSSKPEWIYYNVPAPKPRRSYVKITPAGPGGVPGQGELKHEKTARGSTAFHPTLTLISQPQHPDNNHQTIIMPDAPPNALLTQDFDLPNILPASDVLPTRPQKVVTWNPPKANRVSAQQPTDAPPLATSAINSNSTILIQGLSTPGAALPVPPPPAQATFTSNQNSNIGASSPSQQSDQASGNTRGVVILNTNPNGAVGNISLPVGSRMGSFTITPYGNDSGSPGGGQGSSSGGAGGANGTGGDGSAGVGPGHTGGGGGGLGNDPGFLSINGTDSGNRAGSDLPSAAAISEMVIPIPSKLQLRKNAMTISTGPMGGGGLAVYQALPCGKIYTIFLPMPGTNWALQYCARDDSGAKQTMVAGNNTLRLAEGLVPPQAQTEFDFQRLPVPPEKIGKMIVLKGEIREDGTVANVQIYSGVIPRMDEAARLAFSQWKFSPAMRSGRPVGVLVLVGIDANLHGH